MSSKQPKRKVEEAPSFEHGKLYLQKSEVWSVDFTQSKDFMIVSARDQQFKIKPGDLVYLENDGGQDE